MEIFDKNIALFEKVLDLRSKKNEVLSANIANRETPGFRALDFVFEKQLQNAYYKQEDGFKLKTSDPRHFQSDDLASFTQVKGEINQTYNPEVRMDENSVDLDQEMAKVATNQLMFEANLRMISGKFKTLKDAIVDGGR